MLEAKALGIGAVCAEIYFCYSSIISFLTPYANSTFYIFLDIGTGVGPFFLGFLVSSLGYRGMYLAMAGMTILFMIFFLLVSKNQEYKDIKVELE